MASDDLKPTMLGFAVYRATVEGQDLSFWATDTPTDVRVEGATCDTSVPVEGLPEETFSDDVFENIRCGDVYDSVPQLTKAMAEMQLTDKRVLELGAGMGLPGIWAALSGANVVLSDRHPAVLELLRRNVRLNNTTAEVRSLSWGEGAEWLVNFDLVIAADVLYHEGVVGLFLGTAAAALRPGGMLLLAHKQRDLMDCRELQVEAPHCDLELLQGAIPTRGNIEVFRFIRKDSCTDPPPPLDSEACSDEQGN